MFQVNTNDHDQFNNTVHALRGFSRLLAEHSDQEVVEFYELAEPHFDQLNRLRSKWSDVQDVDDEQAPESTAKPACVSLTAAELLELNDIWGTLNGLYGRFEGDLSGEDLIDPIEERLKALLGQLKGRVTGGAA